MPHMLTPWYEMTKERVTKVRTMCANGRVWNQVADTVACGSIFGLTAETLIDAQNDLGGALDGMTAISKSIGLTRIPLGSILKVAT